uniref:SsrA-binding protein n=1 Tax=candidate division WOR-3 bacterium TaxID=2052148 RepID=A0A7C6EDF2_UNCW3
MEVVATNRKARRDFEILETYEAGIKLLGTEVKSLRNHSASLEGSYAGIENGEVFLYDANIAPYSHGNIFNPDPKRKRKLLLNKDEIKRLYGKTQVRGFTLIPLKLYFNDRGLAKVELGLCRGKKVYDRREEIKRRDLARLERQVEKRRR